MRVERYFNKTVRIDKIECSVLERSADGTHFHYTMTKSEAIQLAKDLLMACGARAVADVPFGIDYWVGVDVAIPKTAGNAAIDPPVHSSMSLDEIQKGARNLIEFSGTDCIERLAVLIIDLAARVKESTPQPGDVIKCSCGQVWRYAKRI